MFSKGNKGSGRPAASPPAKPAAPSIISTDMRIVGDLASDGEIQIDGTVDGDVRSATLLIGEKAVVRGELVAETIRVHGRIEGQIKARAVTLASTARVIGDILHEDLSIDKGAFLEGHCKRMESRAADAPPSKVNLVVGGGEPEPAKPEAPDARKAAAN